MKILFAVRLFSGFVESIRTGKWHPSGAPTIFKLIEALDTSDNELELVFTCKEAVSNLNTRFDRTIKIQGLKAKITLLGGETMIPSLSGRLRWYISERRQARVLLRLTRKIQPDLIYIDRGNLWTANYLARRCQSPVVYRMMGISPSIKTAFNGYRPHQLLNRYQLRAPYGLVICSQDGSGGEYWLDKILAPNVKRVMLFNGVDRPQKPHLLSRQKEDTQRGFTRVLFVGRLDPLKGCNEFITAFLDAWRRNSSDLKAVIVGDGIQAPKLKMRVSQAGADSAVTFTGPLPHADVLAYYRKSDIYVSLNKMGNLSNSNLEAMRSGCCIIVPELPADLGIDKIINDIFPAHSLLRIGNFDDVVGLTEAILYLHSAPQEREARGNATYEIAKNTFPSWHKRIKDEMTLLEKLAANKFTNEAIQ